MNDAEFEREAAQLFNKIGLASTDGLNYFQTNPNSTDWKSSLRVPSRPTARRTSSTGTTSKYSPHFNGQESHQHKSAPLKLRPRERGFAGEESVHSPQQAATSNMSTSGQTTSGHTRRVGLADSRFGFVSSTATGSTTANSQSATDSCQGQPISKRTTTRPAPKPAGQTPAAAANKKVSPSGSWSALHYRLTSSAGVPTVNGNHFSPQPNGYNSIDGNRMTTSKHSQVYFTKLQPREKHLQRQLSGPDQVVSQQSKTQVIHSKPSSFQVLSVSNSSQCILHTSEDGGTSKRHQTLRPDLTTAPSTNTSQISQGQKSNGRLTEGNETNSNSETPATNGIYDTLSPPMSPVEAPQNPPQGKPLIKQQKNTLKMSEAQSLSGAYDRLSPIELAAIRQESESNSHKELARSRSNPVESNRVLRSTSGKSSEGSSMVLKYSYPGQPSQQRKTSGPSHIPVSSMNNDTSTPAKQIKKHMRRHSSEDNSPRKTFSATSSILQRPARYSETNLDQNKFSPSRSSSASLSSPEPPLDRQPQSDSVEKAKLDMHLSQQSLDRRVSDVAVSTVQALSTLIEVITPLASPMKTSQHFRYEAPPTDNKWYTEADDNDSDSSSFPLSPLSPEVPTTSPSETTTSPPPVTSSLVASIGVGMLPIESRLLDSARETVSLAKGKVSTQGQLSVQEGQLSVQEGNAAVTDMRRSKQDETTEQNEITTENVSNTSKPQHETEYVNMPLHETKDVAKESIVQAGKDKSNSSVLLNGHGCVRETTSEDLDKTKSPLVKTDSKVSENRQDSTKGNYRSKDHDYAVIEPIDHDYAILEPEGHHEFFGYCQRCTEPVIGINSGCCALDSVYHSKCFTCSKCSTPLSGKSFYTIGEQIYCEMDYRTTMETCFLCSLRIRDRVLRALDQSYHPDCFRCTTCNICLDGVPYVSDPSNDIYCIRDYHQIYAPRCAVCKQSIVPEQGKVKSLRVKTLDKSYHVECYRCENCNKQLANKAGGGEKCFPFKGHLFCKKCSNSHPRRSVTHNVMGTAL